jgi:ankyrin repeat protein
MTSTIFDLAKNGNIAELEKYTGNVDVLDWSGRTPLFYAIQTNHLLCVKWLVQNGAAVNNYGDDGWGPIHLAAKSGHFDCVLYLVEKGGANVNTQTRETLTSDSCTPLSLVVKNGGFHCAKYLLDKGADVNVPQKHGPLFHAANNGDVLTMELLLSNGAYPYGDIDMLPLKGVCWSLITEARKTFKRKQVV